MAASRKDELWKVFESARGRLKELGLSTPAMLAHDLRIKGALPFTHVLIDEAQDISVPELLLLGEEFGEKPNGLFFAGDIGQRIFRAPFPWSAAQVEIRGRSRSLKVNYRTSHQIRLGSQSLLPETLVEADGSEESRLGVTSVFEGPRPELCVFNSRDEEVLKLASWVQAVLELGVGEDEIAVLARTKKVLEEYTAAFEKTNPGLNFLSMHESKGTEFQAVAVVALDHQILPNEPRLLAARDEAQLDEVMSTERHLLYVAATRARDYLLMSGVTPVSEFFSDLISE